MVATYVDYEHVIRILADRYPKTFFIDPKQRLPLKKGIVDDLTDDDFSVAPALLGRVIEWYCNHFGYRHALQAGAVRVDLNGKPFEKVTPQEQREAESYIAERQRLRAQTVRLHQAVVLSGEALSKDPVIRLQERLNSLRRVMLDTNDKTLRTAFVVAGLKILVIEAEAMASELESASS
jgi:sRNA-binding protein